MNKQKQVKKISYAFEGFRHAAWRSSLAVDGNTITDTEMVRS